MTVTTHLEPLWWIPITYTTEKQLNFNNTQPSKWMNAERSITMDDLDASPSQWILLNVQETGNYIAAKYSRLRYSYFPVVEIDLLQKYFTYIIPISRQR